MRNMNCEAIVLSVMDYAEADKLVTFFSLEHGKLKGLARSAKRSRKRFGGALEPFARLHLQLFLKEGLSTLNGADIVTIFPHIRQDLAKICHAAYVCELVERLVPEGEHNQRLFRLLAAYLEHLDQYENDPADRRFFEINLLKVLGYQPLLSHCAGCGTVITDARGLRSTPSFSGIFCGQCGKTGRPVTLQTILLLNQAMQSGQFGRLRFSPAELAEAGELLDSAIACHLNRPLKSLAFLREILA
jgi:DNA repair protein RecO (recombination protein O)